MGGGGGVKGPSGPSGYAEITQDGGVSLVLVP